MKVLLRNTETRLYYAGNDQWTGDATQARDFEHVEHATRTHQRDRLKGMEAVLVYSTPPCELVLPL